MKHRLRRTLAALALVTAATAAAVTVVVDTIVTPQDTAWGAPDTEADTAWGTTPAHGTGNNDGGTVTIQDTAWG